MALKFFAWMVLIPAGPALAAAWVVRSHPPAALMIGLAVFLGLQLVMGWHSQWRLAQAQQRLAEIRARRRQLRVQR